MFQSTRPRGARPHRPAAAKQIIVSIHAPARGATIVHLRNTRCESFNPRARAGRDFTGKNGDIVEGFQSTRPRGARRFLSCFLILKLVSIHAPARGATPKRNIGACISSFNPRARAGRDATK